MTVLAIARASLLRLMRDRTALFFLAVLPVLVIVIVGATVQGFSTWRVGVVDLGAGTAGRQLTAAVDRMPDLAVSRYPDVRTMSRAIARGELSTGIVLPRGMDRAEREGRAVTVGLVVERANSSMQAAATAVSSVVTAHGARVQAAQFATDHAGGTFGENLARAGTLERLVPRVTVRTFEAQSTSSVLPEGFSYSAPTELVLFVFLSAVAGGATIVETRRLGMFERMSAAPVRPSSIIAGESLIYLVIALVQSALIVGVGSLAFGVSWGDPAGAIALVVVWSAVGAGAGILAGTLFRTPEQASAIGPIVGITFAMLGGCMWPLAIVTPSMRVIGHLTPQAWAVDAWTELLANHGGLLAIGRDLGVLALFAIGLFGVATLRLRRTIATRRSWPAAAVAAERTGTAS